MSAASPVLVAARTKFLANAPTGIGQGVGIDDTAPWVFTSVNPVDGLPWVSGASGASVNFSLRPNQWTSTETSARFPVVACTVWTTGDPAGTEAENAARSVADQLIDIFDNYTREQDPQWTPDVYALGSRWDGSLSVGEVEGKPGMYRADLGIQIALG